MLCLGAAACWLSAEAGARCAVLPGLASLSRMWQEGRQLLQMWVGGHGVTRSNQIRNRVQKHLENCKAADGCDTALSSLCLNWRKRW